MVSKEGMVLRRNKMDKKRWEKFRYEIEVTEQELSFFIKMRNGGSVEFQKKKVFY